MPTHPTVVLHAAKALPPGTMRRLNSLLIQRCGPCCVVQKQGGQEWSRGTTYHLSGSWSITPAEVHTHLIAAFGQLTP